MQPWTAPPPPRPGWGCQLFGWTLLRLCSSHLHLTLVCCLSLTVSSKRGVHNQPLTADISIFFTPPQHQMWPGSKALMPQLFQSSSVREEVTGRERAEGRRGYVSRLQRRDLRLNQPVTTRLPSPPTVLAARRAPSILSLASFNYSSEKEDVGFEGDVLGAGGGKGEVWRRFPDRGVQNQIRPESCCWAQDGHMTSASPVAEVRRSCRGFARRLACNGDE